MTRVGGARDRGCFAPGAAATRLPMPGWSTNNSGADRSEASTATTTVGAWDPVGDMAVRQAVDDHERNPEYELHVGRIVETDQGARRYVSVWLRGRRFHGWLVAGEPEDGADPRCQAGWAGAATGAEPPP